MKRFKNLLLVFEPEADNETAVSLAVSLAKRNQASLTLISVVEDLSAETYMEATSLPSGDLFERVMKDCWEQLQPVIESIGAAGPEARARVVSGTPFLEIIRQVLRDRHDLVMVTAEGTDGFKARLFGSTTMHLMRKCPCPVWAVKPRSQQGFARILATVDPGSPDNEHNALDRLVMDLSTSLASLERSELHVIHAWNLPGERRILSRGVITQRGLDVLLRGVRGRREMQLGDLLGSYSSLDLRPWVHLVKGRAGKEIPELVRQEGIDLLVMGTVCRTGVAGFFIGNTAEEVLSQVNCSVLTVKPEGFVTPVTLE
ncbi:MAG: universal stress protein [Pseudomonadota bacterium]